MNTDVLIAVIMFSLVALFLILCLLCFYIHKSERTHDYRAVSNN